jgi:hypothetical protein
MWTAVGWVTTSLALVAFISGVVSSVARSALRRQEKLIAQAPAAERFTLVQEALESFHVDTTQIRTEEHLVSLLRDQMNARGRDKTRAMGFALAAFVVLCMLAALAITRAPAPAVSRASSPDATPGLELAQGPNSAATHIAGPTPAVSCGSGTNVASCNSVVAGPGAVIDIRGSADVSVGRTPR